MHPSRNRVWTTVLLVVGLSIGIAGTTHAGVITDVVGSFLTDDNVTLEIHKPDGQAVFHDFSNIFHPHPTTVKSLTLNNDNTGDPIVFDLGAGEEGVCQSANCAAFNALFFKPVNAFDIVFNVESSGGTTEYSFLVGVVNFTGQTWGGYDFELGLGTGPDFVAIPSGDGGLDFDTPDRDPIPTSTLFSFGKDEPEPLFTMLRHADNVLAWSNGSLNGPPFVGAPGETGFFTFSLDVPDDIDSLPESAQTDRGYQFTLRQRPTSNPIIPEPSTSLLFGFGGLGGFGLIGGRCRWRG